MKTFRAFADHLLLALRQRFDRPHLLPPDAPIEVTLWVCEIPGQPGKTKLMVHHEPAGLSNESLAKLLGTAAAMMLAESGAIQVEVGVAPSAPSQQHQPARSSSEVSIATGRVPYKNPQHPAMQQGKRR